MLDAKSAGDFAVQRTIHPNDLEGVRIINAINAVWWFYFNLKKKVKSLTTGNPQGQVKSGSEQHVPVKGVPYSNWAFGTRWSLKLFQPNPFYDSKVFNMVRFTSLD